MVNQVHFCLLFENYIVHRKHLHSIEHHYVAVRDHHTHIGAVGATDIDGEVIKVISADVVVSHQVAAQMQEIVHADRRRCSCILIFTRQLDVRTVVQCSVRPFSRNALSINEAAVPIPRKFSGI